MERWLESDAVVRVLSVLVGVLLWLYVTAQGPALTQVVQDVPVQPLYVPAGLAVTAVEPDRVAVAVRGSARALERLSPGAVVATVNLRDAVAGRVVRVVHARVPSGLQVAQVVPPQVAVVLDRLAERQVPVAVDVSGSPAGGTRLGEPEVEPRRVTVRGAARLVGAVRRVMVGVDVEGAAQAVEGQLPAYAVDGAGRPVLGVEILPEQVRVRVPVTRLEPLHVRPVEPVVEGRPAEGAEVVAVRVVPRYAVLRAPEALAARIQGVPTEAVSVAGARETLEVEVPLRWPEGVEPVGPEAVRVRVVIRVRR